MGYFVCDGLDGKKMLIALEEIVVVYPRKDKADVYVSFGERFEVSLSSAQDIIDLLTK